VTLLSTRESRPESRIPENEEPRRDELGWDESRWEESRREESRWILDHSSHNSKKASCCCFRVLLASSAFLGWVFCWVPVLLSLLGVRLVFLVEAKVEVAARARGTTTVNRRPGFFWESSGLLFRLVLLVDRSLWPLDNGFGTTFFDTTFFDAAILDTTFFDTTAFDTNLFCGTTFFATTLFGTAFFGTIFFDTLFLDLFLELGVDSLLPVTFSIFRVFRSQRTKASRRAAFSVQLSTCDTNDTHLGRLSSASERHLKKWRRRSAAG